MNEFLIENLGLNPGRPRTSVFTLNFADESNLYKNFRFNELKIILIWHFDSRARRCVTNDDDHLDFYRWSGIKMWEEEEENDGVAVDSIYLPFHLLFFAGSFLFFYWHRPSRVNRIESVKETDAFSTERQREAEGKGVVTHLSWPSPLWATFPPPPSGPDVWKWNCFNPLTARTKSSRVSGEGKISLWKRQQKMEPHFILFHYRRYDVSVCVCPWDRKSVV